MENPAILQPGFNLRPCWECLRATLLQDPLFFLFRFSSWSRSQSYSQVLPLSSLVFYLYFSSSYHNFQFYLTSLVRLHSLDFCLYHSLLVITFSIIYLPFSFFIRPYILLFYLSFSSFVFTYLLLPLIPMSVIICSYPLSLLPNNILIISHSLSSSFIPPS